MGDEEWEVGFKGRAEPSVAAGRVLNLRPVDIPTSEETGE